MGPRAYPDTGFDLRSLSLPKRRLSVELALVGERLVGEVFLAEYAEDHPGPERVHDLLNGREDFFPLLGSDERLYVLSRQALRWIRVSNARDAVDIDVAGEPQIKTVTLRLDDGSTEQGSVRYVAPDARSRVQDYLNDAPGFFPLFQDGCVLLVNRSRITSVVVEDPR